MKKPWQTCKIKTWGISIEKSHAQKGEYPKCVHVYTRGRKVKRIIITCIQVLNGLMTPNSSFKRHNRVVNFEAVQHCYHLCWFFPVNIKQCSLSGLSSVLADSAIPFWCGKYVWFLCHYWTLITYSHIFFSCYSHIIFSF